jgi:hypothetical protein
MDDTPSSHSTLRYLISDQQSTDTPPAVTASSKISSRWMASHPSHFKIFDSGHLNTYGKQSVRTSRNPDFLQTPWSPKHKARIASGYVQVATELICREISILHSAHCHWWDSIDTSIMTSQNLKMLDHSGCGHFCIQHWLASDLWMCEMNSEGPWKIS